MSGGIFPPKQNALLEILPVKKPIIGMIHLKPLPGSPHYKGESVHEMIDFALEDASRLIEGGIDGLQIENAWDLPFPKPEDFGHETVAAMTAVGVELAKMSKVPIGVNCLANAVLPAIAIAKAIQAKWVRSNQWVNAYIANEGFIEGSSAKAMRYKARLFGDDIKILADVHVKHGSHAIVADRSLSEQTRDNEFFDADILIATGNRTGDETALDEILGIKENASLPVIVGSGMTEQNAKKILSVADGAIVGSFLKENGNWWERVDTEKVKRFMDQVQSLR
ncbi:BtpA protein [Brevibacillus reuszeri]|uniref:BtpA family membrane complex biogenesis protein n=1 Tax=Brevibacillus reuszeri TaxID=54915 RepID=A0A0K9YPC0_9BACL|nr:BtpA family membrane complex biogenesis protein [Brevibacillus reuszeri]GED72970.1 BtpA protein [Brevibacillus reuszeri]